MSGDVRGPLSELLLDLCEQALDQLPDAESREQVANIKTALASPLRVALAGRVSSGKSTIVNALVGQRVAVTDVGECTRVVTWYHYGALEHATFTRRDGTTGPLQLSSDGALPSSLGEDPAGVARIDVWLSSAVLERVTIIDTPGLESLSGADETTRELLGLDRASRHALSDADALLFVMAGDVHEDDVQTLETFTRLSRGLRTTAVNAVGILNKIDRIGGGAPDAVAIGIDRAERLSGVLRGFLATVVPLVGLLAETCDTGAFSATDARALEQLAALEELDRELLLLSADRFLTMPCPVAADARSRLIRLLDLGGTRHALAVICQGGSVSTALADLRESSRIDGLREAVESYFARRIDALKAETAVTTLDGMAWQRLSSSFAGKLGEVLADPRMHGLHELRARQAAADPNLFVPHDLITDLDRLVAGTTLRGRLGLPAGASLSECREAAAAGSLRWTAFGNSGQAGPSARRVAETVRRSFDLMWREAERDAVLA